MQGFKRCGYHVDARSRRNGVDGLQERYNNIQVLNARSGKGCRIGELAEMIAEAADWPGKFRYDATRSDGVPRLDP